MTRSLLPLLLLAACAEDPEELVVDPEAALVGGWRVVDPPEDDGLLRPGTTWLRVDDDHVLHALATTEHGLRSAVDVAFLATEDQLFAELDGEARLYDWSVAGDELVLSRLGVDTTFTRSDEAPEAEAWVPTAEVLLSHDLGDQAATDLAWDGTALWLGNGDRGNQLKRVDPATGGTLSTLTTALFVWGLDFDGEDLWGSSNRDDNIFRLSTDNGAISQSSGDLGGFVDGIAWDGTYLWAHSADEDAFYRYTPIGDEVEVVDTLVDEDGLKGLAAVGTDLLVGQGGYVHRLSRTTFQAGATWRVPGYAAVTGIASDGTRTWVLGVTPDGTTRLSEVALP